MIRYGPILKTECGSNKSGIEAKIQKQENDKTSFFLFLFTTVSRGLSVDHKKGGRKTKKGAEKREMKTRKRVFLFVLKKRDVIVRATGEQNFTA